MSSQSQPDEIAAIEQLLRPVSLANPERVTASAPEPPASLTPLSLILEEFEDGQDWPVISAVRLPDESGWVPSRFVVIRQMTELAGRYVVQTVHPSLRPAANGEWCIERSRPRVDYATACEILAARVRDAV